MLTLYLLCLNILFTFFVSLLFIVSIIRLFKVKPICHWNFWILLFQLHLNLFFYSLTVATLNLFRHILRNYPDLIVLAVLTDIAAIWSSFNNGVLMATLALICVERFFAMLKNETYESTKNPYYVFIGLFLSYFCGFANICVWNVLALNYLMVNISYYTIHTFLITFITSINIKNKKLIRLSQSTNIILTQRYQIHENIRMLKYALPFLIYPSGGLVCVGTLSTCVRIFVAYISAAEINAIYFTGSNLFILFSFYRANFKIISTYFHLFRKNSNRVIILTAKGKHDERQKEGDMYFEQLKNAW